MLSSHLPEIQAVKDINTNSHEVKGNNARYIDYEIGRIQGKYFQNDPVS